MSGKPRVSFVVPCYNYGRFLRECLDSIFSQEGERNFEVIAVDDASTDDTAEVLASFGDPRLRVVRHAANRGHVATVNHGLAMARGEYVARIDPDDRYRPNFLLATVPKFLDFPEVGLVYGDAALIDERGRVTVERCAGAGRRNDFRGNELLGILEDNHICAPTAIARREMWWRALPIPAGLAFNDWYFNVMMARASDFYYVHQVIADYRVHTANHHTRITRDRSEEPSILGLLQRVFSEIEPSAALEAAKRAARGRIYGKQYLTLADKYFGNGMNGDARRCYWRAVRNRPSYLLRADLQRRLIGTLIGRHRYEIGKSLIKDAFALLR
jgi:glycosyltransferase involved in cell wall biosynthesis